MKTDTFQPPCGCVLFKDPEWGVTRSYKRCTFHISEGGKSGIAHHEVMGAIKDGVVQHATYEKELREPLEEIGVDPVASDGGFVLEIGCGVGAYMPFFLDRGYLYVGIEPDKEVAQFLNDKFRPLFACQTWEEYKPYSPYELIFCAHAFEHMEDAPGMMAKAFSQLKPGGRLLLIIPNDDDLMNPDHLWFFNESTLRSTLERVGFQDIRMVSKRRVPQELFIYASGVKPL